MKYSQRKAAVRLRQAGYSMRFISQQLDVAKSSVSLWVRHVELAPEQIALLKRNSHTTEAIEKRRTARLASELKKRNTVIDRAYAQIGKMTDKDLFNAGVMLYWAEGGKTRRSVRFSNGDPRMIKLMMLFFRKICKIPESKFRGHIHIHQHLDAAAAEKHWSQISEIPPHQFYKTYNKPNKSSKGFKDTLPNGVMDIYVLDTALFLKITGWIEGIFAALTVRRI